MNVLKTLLFTGLILFTTKTFSQDLPEGYQAMLNEMVIYFSTIRTGNSITKGNTSIRVVNEKRIVLVVKHKGQIKNMTFEQKPDEESEMQWKPSNILTIDMVNKYEEYVTGILKEMHDLAEKKSME